MGILLYQTHMKAENGFHGLGCTVCDIDKKRNEEDFFQVTFESAFVKSVSPNDDEYAHY